mmetsp:Transcript_33273/g.37198  ORF Transcript_33273/g.37198 Transcript_33273/m.37198 type:complete len:203 (-) Transcript_33273:1349-1957(-)
MNSAALIFGTYGTFSSPFLVWCRCTKGCIHCKTHNLPLRKHRLNVPTTVLRKDHTATSTFSISFLTCKLNKIRIDWCCVYVKHKLLGDLRNVWRIFLVLIFFVRIFLFILIIILVILIILIFILLFIHLWRRWRWRGHHFVIFHGSINECSTRCNSELYRQSQIFTIDLSSFKSSCCSSHLTCKNLGTVSLTSSSDSFLAKI